VAEAVVFWVLAEALLAGRHFRAVRLFMVSLVAATTESHQLVARLVGVEVVVVALALPVLLEAVLFKVAPAAVVAVV
jgi:hypothetical protein